MSAEEAYIVEMTLKVIALVLFYIGIAGFFCTVFFGLSEGDSDQS